MDRQQEDMKPHDEALGREVEATLAVTEGIQPVPPPADLHQRVMARIANAPAQAAPLRPTIWRPIAAAAAIVLIAINVFSLLRYASTPQTQNTDPVAQASSIEDLQQQYFPDEYDSYQ